MIVQVEQRYDPMESWRQFQQQQALEGIYYELRQMRMNQDFDNSYRQDRGLQWRGCFVNYSVVAVN
jgi:hypothetical protein